MSIFFENPFMVMYERLFTSTKAPTPTYHSDSLYAHKLCVGSAFRLAASSGLSVWSLMEAIGLRVCSKLQKLGTWFKDISSWDYL